MTDLPALKKLCLEASALPWHFSAAGFTKDAEGKVVSLDYRQEQVEKNEKFLLEATTAMPKLIERIEHLAEVLETVTRIGQEYQTQNQSLKAELEEFRKNKLQVNVLKIGSDNPEGYEKAFRDQLNRAEELVRLNQAMGERQSALRELLREAKDSLVARTEASFFQMGKEYLLSGVLKEDPILKRIDKALAEKV